MSTDFFERQSQARRSTKWLVAMFSLAVVGIVAGVFVVATLAVRGTSVYQQARGDQQPNPQVQWGVPIAAAVASLVLIAGGSLYKIAELRGGGTTVAEHLGGRRVLTNTTDPVERRLLNVVEEMALASGVPVPPVYLLPEEQGINAFAAGYSPSDAVVAVTRGTAEQLSRDELQGVVAHEFSHILNGDMRLNIRLIGILNGILLLGLIGQFMLRSAAYSRGNSKNSPAPYILLIGLATLVLGFAGTLMGNLIKAAVSRQREYLADASAVQFTRNPGGIAGALKRIGGYVSGSKIQHANAAEMSHMYFSQGVWEGFTGLMATHPPLKSRILRLDPQWDGKFPVVEGAPAVAAEVAGAMGLVGSERFTMQEVDEAAEHVGNPTANHRRYARQLIDALPSEVVAAAREPYGARAVLYCLLLDANEEVRQNQFAALAATTTPDVVALVEKLAPSVRTLDERSRLPLVDMALPALRTLAPPQYKEFRQTFRKLVEADQRIALFEWTLHRVLLRHLRPQFEKATPSRVTYYGLQRLGRPVSVLLSTLAYAGSDADEAHYAFDKAASLVADVKLELVPAGECGLKQLEASLETLSHVAVKQRERLVDACAAAICADAEINIREAELLRGICDMLDCPMPPLLAGQQVP